MQLLACQQKSDITCWTSCFWHTRSVATLASRNRYYQNQLRGSKLLQTRNTSIATIDYAKRTNTSLHEASAELLPPATLLAISLGGFTGPTAISAADYRAYHTKHKPIDQLSTHPIAISGFRTRRMLHVTLSRMGCQFFVFINFNYLIYIYFRLFFSRLFWQYFLA